MTKPGPSLEEEFCRPGCNGNGLVAKPSSLRPKDFCNSLANLCSSSVHFGMPTISIFFCTASAIALLPRDGHAAPTAPFPWSYPSLKPRPYRC